MFFRSLTPLFSDIFWQITQGKKQITIPPCDSVDVVEEDGLKIVDFEANGIGLEARAKNRKMWVVLSDGTFLAMVENGEVFQCNQAYLHLF